MILAEGRSFSGHERNCCYLNTGKQRFANISAVSGFDFADDSRAIATVDWDGDGDLDLWVSNRNAPQIRFLRNETPRGNHFLMVRLLGNGTTTSRDAIGARVEVVLRAASNGEPEATGEDGTRHLKSIRTLRAGEGFLAQSSKWLHFGLGDATHIDRVSVRWPGGPLEIFEGLDVDRHYRLEQGTGRPRVVRRSATDSKVAPGVPQVPPVSDRARIPLVTVMPVPKLSYRNWDGTQQVLPIGTGKPVLLNLWASWCRPCLAELAEFKKHEEQLRSHGVQVIALSVDGLSGQKSNSADALPVIRQIGFPFPSGHATPRLVALLQMLHNRVIKMKRPLPVPTSFLIDGKGRLAVIYKGRITPEEVLADLGHSSGNRLERFVNAASFPGSIVHHDIIARALLDEDLNQRLRFADALAENRQLSDAAEQYAEALKIDPKVAEAHNNLGFALMSMGRIQEAKTHYEQTLRLNPDYAEAHNNLANILRDQGRINEAMTHYAEAIRLKPDYANAFGNRGATYRQAGKFQLALKNLNRAIELDPNHVLAHGNRGATYRQLGKLQLALRDLDKAIQLGLHNAVVYYERGKTSAQLGKFDPAVGDYTKAIELKSNYAVAYHDRAEAYNLLGNYEAAVDGFRKTIELDPKFAAAYNNLAWLLATCPDAKYRDGKQAVANATRARALLAGDDYSLSDTLAAAYAASGDFAAAIGWQTKAVELAPAADQAELEARLELYKARKPYRESR